MAKNRATIDGSNKLSQIQAKIAGEESLATRFEKSQIKTVSGKKVNQVIFDEIDEVPGDIVLALKGEDAPDGFSEEWSGEMQVEGAKQKVVLFRKT